MYVKRKLKGFTLIELLVVVSIIALLVSILLPALSKAREQAKIVVCAGNLRSMNMAYQFYATENNDIFTIYRTATPYLVPPFAKLMAGGYISDPQAMYCPNCTKLAPYDKPLAPANGNITWTFMASYSHRPYVDPRNWSFYGYRGGWFSDTEWGPPEFLKMDQIRYPSQAGLLCDLLYNNNIRFHDDKWNLTFIDGHGQTVQELDSDLYVQMGIYDPYSFSSSTWACWKILERYANGVSASDTQAIPIYH